MKILRYTVVVRESSGKIQHEQDFPVQNWPDALIRAKNHAHKMSKLCPDGRVTVAEVCDDGPNLYRIMSDEELET